MFVPDNSGNYNCLWGSFLCLLGGPHLLTSLHLHMIIDFLETKSMVSKQGRIQICLHWSLTPTLHPSGDIKIISVFSVMSQRAVAIKEVSWRSGGKGWGGTEPETNRQGKKEEKDPVASLTWWSLGLISVRVASPRKKVRYEFKA